ncbi:copper chaperone PCu(A)C [Rugamonas sp.]|uniref:copper chaperone PCu(A)C n=1 Tax=Rugamonas sp. TaxID=1926287 RepID=UPI0025E7C256|nr:copper chaperone PCu(A)C [Rugamonas sp.]
MKKLWAVSLLSLSFASGALAQVSVKDAWIRATVPAAKAGGAFMRLQSAQDARLVAVRSPVAGVVEIHQMEMAGETMKMHAVAGLDLPAGKPVDLASGGYHVMLLDLKHQLKEGETVPLTLVIEQKNKKTDTMLIQVPVKALTYTAPAPAR